MMGVARRLRGGAVVTAAVALLAPGSLAAFSAASTPPTPTVSAVVPSTGPSFGGNQVVVKGTGFSANGVAAVTGVNFGALPAVFFRVDSDTQLTATAPAQVSATATAVDVTVTTAAGASQPSSGDRYSYVRGAWTPTAAMENGDTGVTAMVLPGDKALLAGQFLQVFDESAHKWATLSGPSIPVGHVASIADSSGDVLLSGGRDAAGAVATAELFLVAKGSLQDAAAMSTPRVGHSATVLDGPKCRAPDPPKYCGQVLVAGGFSADGAASLSSAELFDPTASTTTGGVTEQGAWKTTGSMVHGRAGHVAVPLDGPACHEASPPPYCGKVLVAGGSAFGGPFANSFLTSAELYDPEAGSWSEIPGLDSCQRSSDACRARYQAQVVALSGGAVLVAGGQGNDGGAVPLASAEVYDPSSGSSGSWRSTGPMSAARLGGAVVAFGDGALAAGGQDARGNTLASADLYEPDVDKGTGGWSQTASMGAARAGHGAVVLSSGRVLAAGGQDASGNLLASAELYDPSPVRPKPTVSQVEPASGPLAGGTTVTVTGSALYSPTTVVTFGDAPAASVMIHSDTELVAVTPPAPGGAPATVHVRVTTPEGVSDDSDANSFTYAGGGWTKAADLTSCPPQPPSTSPPPDCAGRKTHDAVLLDGPPCHPLVGTAPRYCGEVLVMGGTIPQTFTDGTTAKGSKTLHSDTANFTPDDVGYGIIGAHVGGGGVPDYRIADGTVITAVQDRTNVTLSQAATADETGVVFSTRAGTAETYDPATGRWQPTGRMTVERAGPIDNDLTLPARFTATVLDDGRVLVAGGCCAPYSSVPPSISGGGGYVPVAFATAEIYDPVTRMWAPTGSMSTPRSGHTATLLSDDTCRQPPRPIWCGKVLVTGGQSDNNILHVLDSAELYDPATGAWSPVRSTMGAVRVDATATLLSSHGGEVLVTGGVGHSEPGNKLICNFIKPDYGCHESPLASAEVYSLAGSGDGTAGSWRPTGCAGGGACTTPNQMQLPRAAHHATVLSGPGCATRCGQVLVTGGALVVGAAVGELYDPEGDRWSATGPMVHDRFLLASATLLASGTVLVAGGASGVSTGPTYVGDLGPTAETYDPATNGWTSTPPMITDRLNHSDTRLDGPACRVEPRQQWCDAVLVAGGESPIHYGVAPGLASVEMYIPPPPAQPPSGGPSPSGGCPAVGSAGTNQVAYPGGYSLVGLPDHTVIPSDSPLYSWVDQGAGGSYTTQVKLTPMVGGAGYWAWFRCPHLVDVPAAGTATMDLPLGAYHASMVGNPSRQKVTVSGFDYAVRWDPTQNGGAGGYQLSGYRENQTLDVGQGMWVFSYTDTTIHIRPAT